jgi:hypothetical protein
MLNKEGNMSKLLKQMRTLAIAVCLSLTAVWAQPAGAQEMASRAPDAVDSARNGTTHECSSEGCTYLKVQRDNTQVTIWAWGDFYKARAAVWVQINITNSATGEVLYRDMERVSASGPHGRTRKKTVFIDCDVAITATAWTWLAGSNTQPVAELAWQ